MDWDSSVVTTTYATTMPNVMTPPVVFDFIKLAETKLWPLLAVCNVRPPNRTVRKLKGSSISLSIF